MTDWSPFAFSQRMGDLGLLAASTLFAGVAPKDLYVVTELLELAVIPAGEVLLERGEAIRGAMFILGGLARATGDAELGPGGLVGEIALHGEAVAEARVIALTELRVACLTSSRFEVLRMKHPSIAEHMLRNARRAPDAPRPKWADPADGTTVASVVPTHVDGALVVGARLRHRTVSLGASVPAASVLEPLTVRDWEGREIYRRAAGLVFLEAANRHGRSDLSLGASWTSGRLVLSDETLEARLSWAARLDREVGSILDSNREIREETWDLDRAIEHFSAKGWKTVAYLLESSVESFVRLVSCGEVMLPRPGAMLPRVGMLSDIHVRTHQDGYSLDFGEVVRAELAKRAVSTVYLESRSPRYGAEMSKEEQRWLDVLGITSVGNFNRAAITGEVRELVSVSEGFQEKRLALLADQIRGRGNVRIIAVAGPSSSGKTTFLKRLNVQLKVDGLRPVGISLDDYYVDRERTVRDAAGEYDYEAFEAIDGALLSEHLGALLKGERVKTARYDFTTGKSDPKGGDELVLEASTVLVLEGIHALDPRLIEGHEAEVFRIFIHPATALPFDPLSTFEPADVRLLRRIVRDRHTRGATAESNLSRWPSVRRGERLHIYPHQGVADHIFDTSLIYEVSVLKVFAERYLLEVPRSSKQCSAAIRLRRLLAPFVTISPDHVPPTSILREFIGERGFLW